MKKQFIVMASLATILGLSFYSAKNISIDDRVGKKDEDKSYIVLCEGDVLKDSATSLKYSRNKVLNQLNYVLPEGSFEVTNIYDTVLNGFAITVNSRYEDLIKSINGVSEVSAAHTFARPEAVVENGFDSMLPTDGGYETRELRLENYSARTMHSTDADVAAALAKRGGIDASSQQGKNVTIGIIDSGLYLNQVEGSAERNEALESGALNPAAFTNLSAGEFKYSDADVQAKGFNSTYYSRINDKVFFTRDYEGNDNDVDPTNKGNEHGTHVASLAAANGEVFQGIAPKAQLAIMKVFPDSDAGAPENAVIAAINDAAKLGLDIINLSLGTDLNTTDDSAEATTYLAIQNATSKGVIVNYAAGNSGKSSFSASSSYAYWNRDMVETSILGGEAHLDESANIIAASNPNEAFFSSILTVKNKDAVNSTAVSYDDQVESSPTQPALKDRPLTSLLPEGESSKEFDYVVIPGFGKESDFKAVDAAHGIEEGQPSYVNGKIAVVSRGTTSFVSKVKNAEAAGALAMICINNDPSVTFNFSMDFADYSPSIPVVFVFQNTRNVFGLPEGDQGNEGTLVIATNTAQTASDGNMIASFSSDGGEANLDMGVTSAAPGKEVMGAVDATYYNDNSDPLNPGFSYLTGYENMSGTSMAAPNFTGALALYLSEKNPDNGGTLAVKDAEAYAAEKKAASMKAMSSAEKLVSTTGDGTYASPRLQGAGRIDIAKMLTSDSYITVPNEDLEGFTNTVQSKVELKNTKSLKVDFSDETDTKESYIEFDYTIHNDSNVERTYKPTLSVMVPNLIIANTHDEYIEMEESSRAEIIGYDKNVPFDPNDLNSYPYGVGQITVSVNDDLVKSVEMENVVVPANGTITATCKVRIDNLPFSKDFNDSKVENFEGTLKEYFKKYFENAGGNYVEGYLDLKDVSTAADANANLSIPYLGFYGDYTKADAVEPFDFEREDRYLYNSDLVSNYMQNLADAYKKINAYAGSTLSATGAPLTSSQFDKINNFDISTKANGMDFLSVTDGSDKTHIYAGAPGVSDHLIATFFVNRAVSKATYTVATKDGKAVKTGDIRDLFTYGTIAGPQDMGELMKSYLVANNTSYMIHRGYADIDLTDVAEGEYNLSFSFTPKGTGVAQVKTYALTVDKTAPSLAGLSISKDGEDDVLDVVTRGASNVSVNVTVNRDTEAIEGTDFTKTNFYMNPSWIESDKIYLGLTDRAHNQFYVLVRPSQIEFSIGSTFFTNKNDFVITLIRQSNGTYTYSVDVLNANGDPITRKKDMTIFVQLSKGLNAEEIVVSVDGEKVEVEYNAETGLVSFNFNKDAATFTINQSLNGGSGGDSSSTGGGESSGTSEGTPSKGGCGGSVAIASSTIGALALLATGIALKKKKENK